ncbi:DUF6090 family protein [Winogradskyella sp. MH6]|uniref:DUF6090 family protein n=1 Tax=Winogradskyella sp. MH6 TaxID=2929510 RepID=UPI001FB4BC27|nr:DUF6090 family protein [Winogradskyella sp. MH6]
MIKFFRSIRKRLIHEGKTTNYLKYAIGEIVLVVIGILIALQINNWNENRKLRNQELNYLENLRSDMNLNINDLNQFLDAGNTSIESANKVLDYYEGRPLEDINDFNFQATNVYVWYRFTLHDNTYQELINSGNIAVISNDSIKKGVLNLQALYHKLKSEEDHFRYDMETLMYEPAYEMLDMNDLIKNFTFHVTDGQAGENVNLSRASYEAILKSVKHKNGFVMAVYEHSKMNSHFNEMKDLCSNLIALIDAEFEKD